MIDTTPCGSGEGKGGAMTSGAKGVRGGGGRKGVREGEDESRVCRVRNGDRQIYVNTEKKT